MDMSFRQRQTAAVNGTFQVLSWGDTVAGAGGGSEGGGVGEAGGGSFVGTLFKNFEKPIYGGGSGGREGGREGERGGCCLVI